MIWHARQSVPLGRSNPGRALMIIWSREGVFATRAHSSGRAFIILIACEVVVATRAQTSWASIDNSKGTVFAKKAQSSQVSFDNNHNT